MPRNPWTACKALAVVLLVAVATPAAADSPFIEAATVATRGAAGWTHFRIGDRDFLAVANFFTSAPGTQPRMETSSVLYEAWLAAGTGFAEAQQPPRLELNEVQKFPTVGAHGVCHFHTTEGHDYIAIPNYYGGDSAVYRWNGAKSKVSRQLRSNMR